MRKIYFLLTKTGTIPSMMIHSILGGPFTHVSIALSPTTDHFYSFARRTLHNPFNAGFMIENIHTHVFSKYPNCNCAVYELEISDKAYKDLETVIASFENNSELFNYNFLGLLPAKLGIKYNRKRHFTCSQFVATVVHRSGIAKLPKDPSLMMPNDFLDIQGMVKVYQGKLKNCKIHSSRIPATVWEFR